MALMTCLAVDMDLSENGKPQFGPETFRTKADAINAGERTKRTGGNQKQDKVDDEKAPTKVDEKSNEVV
jgi:hypothetical protein